MRQRAMWDVFISHAWEDKAAVVRPLVAELEALGLSVWVDQFVLTIGDSLRRKIEHGLSHSRYGVVILSHQFFSKDWPQKELDALVAREVSGEKVILPVWHQLTRDEVLQYSPLLADRLAADTARGIPLVAREIALACSVDSSSSSARVGSSSDWRVNESRLPFGTTVITENVGAAGSAMLSCWVPAGPRYEEDRESGLSYLVQNTLFRGTVGRRRQRATDAFEALGAKVDAFTSKEYTCFLTDQPCERVYEVAGVLLDMVGSFKVGLRDLEEERAVVIETIRAFESAPDERIHDLFAAAVFGGHPLAKPIMGTEQTVASFDHNMARGYFDKQFSPQKMTVVAVGDVEHDRIVDLVTTKFEHTPAPSEREPSVRLALPRRSTYVVQEGPFAHLCYGCRGLSLDHPDRFALSVLDHALGGSAESVLHRELVLARRLSDSAYSYYSTYRDVGLVAAYAQVEPAVLEEATAAVMQAVERMRSGGITRQAFAHARESLGRELADGLDKLSNRMARLGKASVSGGERLSDSRLADRLASVTYDDVTSLAQHLFSPEKMVLTVISPPDG